jgi:hypothetical protein
MTHQSAVDHTAYGSPHVVEYAVRSEAEHDLQPLGRATWYEE